MNAAMATVGSRNRGYVRNIGLDREAARERALNQEYELLARARAGEENALVEIFDAVIYDVYSYAFLETGKVYEAERIADATGAELAWIVRGRDIMSFADIRDRLMHSASVKVQQYRASQARLRALGDMRASMRHIFLAGSALVSLVFAGALLIGG